MAQMKMRTKITSGFVLMMALLLTVSVVAILFLSSASTDFIQYRDWATDSNVMSSLQENMLMVRMNVKDFLISGEEKEKQEFDNYIALVKEEVKSAHEEILNARRAPMVRQIDDMLVEYEETFGKVVQLQARRDDLVIKGLDEEGPDMEKNLTEILVSARADNDMDAAYYASLAQRDLMLARLYAFKFLDSNTKDDEKRVLDELEVFRGHLGDLDSLLDNADRRALFEEVQGGVQ